MDKVVSKYFSKIGAEGGKAGTGPAKARSSAQARKAALARWKKAKARKSS